ncbi:NfeD family protein [Arcanobacterium phocae]|uniref:Membrane protein implicated in regulation of membrane protease activity n=1 Tax=Arcanobacterium phocae TaxID=131112 RepID=A0A1H2LIB9_9ACTO|nr:NfeD family protein [Arcanobacterium phocae]SDU80803.1 Membrane protein implicated in regulation of membrane protease activity [Arcanobacterium phocae]
MAWGIWAIISAVLLILEMLTVDFTFTMVAGGALAAAAVSAIGGNLVFQVITFVIVSAVLLFLVRPWARRHVNNSSAVESNVYAMSGQEAVSLTRIDRASGQIKINGEVWSAKTGSDPIEAGVNVVVTSVEGAQAIVVPA